jgi:hypothetical protein
MTREDPSAVGLRPVKLRGVVLAEDSGARSEPVVAQPLVKLVREVKGHAEPASLLPGRVCHGAAATGRLLAGPGTAALAAADRVGIDRTPMAPVHRSEASWWRRLCRLLALPWA